MTSRHVIKSAENLISVCMLAQILSLPSLCGQVARELDKASAEELLWQPPKPNCTGSVLGKGG